MEYVKGISATLASDEVTSGGSSYPAWVAYSVSGTRYYAGDYVYSDPADGGNGHEYKLQYVNSLVSETRPEDITGSWAPYPWLDLGPAQQDVTTYASTAGLSEYPNWATGAVTKGERVYDAFTHRDYEALQDLSSGDNTLRPSSAVQSKDEIVAGYWYDLGAANAFRCLDGEIDTRTTATGSIVMTVEGSGQADRLALVGLQNVASATVIVNRREIVPNADFASSNINPWLANISSGATATWASNAMTLTSLGSTDRYVSVRIDNLTPGVSYRATVTASGSSGQWRPHINNAANDGQVQIGAVRSGAGTTTVTFTATETRCHLYLGMLTAGGNVTFTLASFKQTTFAQETYTIDLEYGSTGIYRTIKSIAHGLCSHPTYQITLTGPQVSETVGVGMCLPGKSSGELAQTRVDVQGGRRDYSRRERRDDGTITYVPGASSSRFTATCQVSGDDGDWLRDVLASALNTLSFWDFNNGGTDYARLQIYGWIQEHYLVTTGMPGLDTLVIEMEGMVE
jgi:hypothetical protein